MSQRKDKKLRQLYRRDLSRHAEERAKTIDSEFAEFTEKLDSILKPAPKWIPAFIWVSLQRIFLNI
jgi:hypothetical protein